MTGVELSLDTDRKNLGGDRTAVAAGTTSFVGTRMSGLRPTSFLRRRFRSAVCMCNSSRRGLIDNPEALA